MREPAAWLVEPGPRLRPGAALDAIRCALRGPTADRGDVPAYLLPHQVDAFQRICGSLAVFGGALLADAVGLGKSYVACAVAGRYASTTIVVPASLRGQWLTLVGRLGMRVATVTHEALSRGARLPRAELVVVDEAHRFRNPRTRRYERLACGIGGARLLLVTATPVVNAPTDLVHLLRLFLADHALAPFGVSSLEAVGDLPRLLHAVLPLTVARSERAARLSGHLPVPRDGDVQRAATVSAESLDRLMTRIATLRIPPLGQAGRALVRRHLLHRLASSVEALSTSVRRHVTYLRRAEDAAAQGTRLSRGDARRLVSEEPDDQLALMLTRPDATRLSTTHFVAERRRLDGLAALARHAGPDDKRHALQEQLEQRTGRKTIVFTSARDTAVAIARALGWRRVAVVTGTGARIASGPLPIAEALARFAPRSQGAPPAPPAMRLDVLVATDLASEGLNLQDADTIVHYDLPWNPLRLAQRLGRIARLGSEHREVHVLWFAPPPRLERTLRQLEIIERKARAQLALPVATTGTVGRASVASATLETRELLASPGTVGARGYVVLSGAIVDLAIVRWKSASVPVPEVVRLDGAPLRPSDLTLGHAQTAASEAPLDPRVHRRAARLLQAKLRASATVPRNEAARVLARRVLALARLAGRRRDVPLLEQLDGVLIRVRDGVAVGAERELAALLTAPSASSLRQWLRHHPARRPVLADPTIETLVLGDGPPPGRS